MFKEQRATDADHDGTVTLEEMQAFMPWATAACCGCIDAHSSKARAPAPNTLHMIIVILLARNLDLFAQE
jgi:hypothetical protein